MKVLFVSSGNAGGDISPIIKNQGESLRKEGLEIHFFPIKGKGIFSYMKHVFILRAHLKKNNFDIFHAHYSLSAFTASLAGCKPLVVSLMGSDTKSGTFWKFIIQVFCRLRWDILIVKSQSMKNDLGISTALIIPNGVDVEKIRPQEKIKSSNGKSTLLFAANPDRYAKNYPLAEKALSLIKNENIILKVVHSKSHEELIREFNNSDVLLLTSHWEGSPNIIKEAMACNCPMVSTDVGDVRWVIGTTEGCYLTSFNPEDVAEKIQLALNFAEKRGRTNGRDRIIELGLDSKSIAIKIINTYKNL